MLLVTVVSLCRYFLYLSIAISVHTVHPMHLHCVAIRSRIVMTIGELASQARNTCLSGYIMMYIYYTQTFLVWKNTMLTRGKRQHFVEIWFKMDFVYTWLLIMSLTHEMYIFQLYVVWYQTLHYSHLRLHPYGHKCLPWGEVSLLQPKQHNPDHIYSIMSTLHFQCSVSILWSQASSSYLHTFLAQHMHSVHHFSAPVTDTDASRMAPAFVGHKRQTQVSLETF